ncbi:MAG: HEAT repeat domain-containing protein [Verrucomicrobia subdivision 3 bacterium]|nr:HEAT repeat domain-containing protein [Limisphaerales bacterium]
MEGLLMSVTDFMEDKRQMVIRALGKIGNPNATDALIRALNDDCSGVRQEAALALGAIKAVGAVEPLVLSLGDKSPKVRDAAMQALLAIDPCSVERMIRLLGSQSDSIQLAVSAALVRMGEGKLVDVVAGTLANQVSALNDLRGLVASGDSRALLPLIEALSHPDLRVRISACNALGAVGDSRGIAALFERFADPSQRVQEAACTALIRFHDLITVDPWVEGLQDSREFVRNSARMVLNEIWRYWGPKLTTLYCERDLVMFAKHSPKSGFGASVYYPACPACGHASHSVKCSRLVLVLDSSRTYDTALNGEALRINWLVRGNLFDFHEVEITQACDEEVQRFLGLLRSDHHLQARCKGLPCRMGEQCTDGLSYPENFQPPPPDTH